MSRLRIDPLHRSIVLTLVATGFAVSCLPKEDDGRRRFGDTGRGTSGYYSYGYSGYDDYDDYYGYDDSFGPEDVSLSLSSGGVTLTLVNADSGFDFGILESGACGEDCWLAEGCFESTGGYAFCHDAGTTGVSLATVATPDEVVSSATTLFSDSLADAMTYVLDDGSDCYTWGSTPGYYIDYGCTAW